MSKILKRTGTAYFINDTGETVPADGQLVIDPTNYNLYANSSDVITALTNSDLIYNDGSNDLTLSEAIDHIKGFNFKPTLDANGNQTIRTQRELGLITTKMARGSCTLDNTGYGEINITVPTGGREVAGGSSWFAYTLHLDSYVIVEVHHPIAGKIDSYSDDDLGGANEGWYVEPDGVVRVQAMDFFGSLPEGLILKVKVQHGAGASADGTKAYCNIQWGKK